MRLSSLMVLCYFVLGWNGAAIFESSAILANDAPASAAASLHTDRPPKKQKKKKRPDNAEKVVGKQAEAISAPRFQMLAAGHRVIILDTQTGETRVIEPEDPTQQTVRIGKSWVTVTIQVNVSGNGEKTGKLAPAAK